MPARIGPKTPKKYYLRQWREYHRLTQQQVADRIGCAKHTISRWETGARGFNPGVYAEALGEPVERLSQHPPAPEPMPDPKAASGSEMAELRRIIAEVTAEVLRRRASRR